MRVTINQDGKVLLEDFVEKPKYLVHIADEDWNEVVYKTPREIINYLDMRDCYEFETYEIIGFEIYEHWEPGIGSRYDIVSKETGEIVFWGYGTDH